ncbi:MAG: ribosome-binding factor A, partial [Candidatus Dadabacteria bacterium]
MSKTTSVRSYRVGERIREIVARYLLTELQEYATTLTITAVIVSKDLATAKVYWLTAEDAEKENVQSFLEENKKKIRQVVARELG